jgi:2'-5' RNA ligase
MSNTIRCFLALKMPAETALRRILKELAAMGRALKAVEPDHLHVTLKFFAAVEPEVVEGINAIAATVASRHERGQITLSGLGVFPHAQRPNVIWAGLDGPGARTLSALASDLDEPLEKIGLTREDRPFQPHLTLARVKARPPEALRELLARNTTTVFGTAAVDEIELIRSELGSEGSRYTVLERFPLSE